MTDEFPSGERPRHPVRSHRAQRGDDGLPLRIVAIGDIHGMAGHFARLLDAASALPAFADAAYYILGDMVDRGPDSKTVVEMVASLIEDVDGSRAFIGNHDVWFRRFLRAELDDEEILDWLAQGGMETLASYGVDLARPSEVIRRAILARAPSPLRLLDACEPIATVGAFAFVHAGVDPARSMTDQSPHDCSWIRAPFMKHVGALSHIVVHGHTPQKGRRPTVTENRISIDTGACFGGLLTAALIDREAGSIDFLSTDGSEVVLPRPRREDRGLGTILDRYGSALV